MVYECIVFHCYCIAGSVLFLCILPLILLSVLHWSFSGNYQSLSG